MHGIPDRLTNPACIVMNIKWPRGDSYYCVIYASGRCLRLMEEHSLQMKAFPCYLFCMPFSFFFYFLIPPPTHTHTLADELDCRIGIIRPEQELLWRITAPHAIRLFLYSCWFLILISQLKSIHCQWIQTIAIQRVSF